MARPPDPERRDQILDQAFGLFAERGYGSVGMRLLARELGATTGKLYHWFDSKEALFEAVLGRQIALVIQQAIAILPAEPGARLAALGAWLDAESDRLSDLLRVSLDYQRQPGVDPALLSRAVAAVRAALIAQVSVPAHQADRVMALILGGLVLRQLDPTGAGPAGVLGAK